MDKFTTGNSTSYIAFALTSFSLGALAYTWYQRRSGAARIDPEPPTPAGELPAVDPNHTASTLSNTESVDTDASLTKSPR